MQKKYKSFFGNKKTLFRGIETSLSVTVSINISELKKIRSPPKRPFSKSFTTNTTQQKKKSPTQLTKLSRPPLSPTNIKINKKNQKLKKRIKTRTQSNNLNHISKLLKKDLFYARKPHQAQSAKMITLHKSTDTTNKGITKREFLENNYKVLSRQEISEIMDYDTDKIYYYSHFRSSNNNKRSHSSTNIEKTNEPQLLRNNSSKNLKTISLSLLKKHKIGIPLIKGNHINFRYEILKVIDQGTFGICVKCVDHKTSKVVCIKVIKPNFDPTNEEEILKLISSKSNYNESNIIKYLRRFTYKNTKFIVFELLQENIYSYLSEQPSNQIELRKIKYLTTNILFALAFLKNLNIIHGDIKPENILLSNNGIHQVKLIDFGTSCFNGNDKNYSYIQSRFYRAPEVAFGYKYSFPIDIWSLGCVLCELFKGKPIFDGENERDLIYSIMEYLESPPTSFIMNSPRRQFFFTEEGEQYDEPNSRGIYRTPKSKTLGWFLKGADYYFIDFVKRCLRWLPDNRHTPEQALMHPWIIKDMTSDQLFTHKRKIVRISKGWSKMDQIKKEKKITSFFNLYTSLNSYN